MAHEVYYYRIISGDMGALIIIFVTEFSRGSPCRNGTERSKKWEKVKIIGA